MKKFCGETCVKYFSKNSRRNKIQRRYKKKKKKSPRSSPGSAEELDCDTTLALPPAVSSLGSSPGHVAPRGRLLHWGAELRCRSRGRPSRRGALPRRRSWGRPSGRGARLLRRSYGRPSRRGACPWPRLLPAGFSSAYLPCASARGKEKVKENEGGKDKARDRLCASGSRW